MFGFKYTENEDYEDRKRLLKDRYLNGRKDYKDQLLNALKSDCLNKNDTLTIQDIIEWIDGIK